MAVADLKPGNCPPKASKGFLQLAILRGRRSVNVLNAQIQHDSDGQPDTCDLEGSSKAKISDIDQHRQVGKSQGHVPRAAGVPVL